MTAMDRAEALELAHAVLQRKGCPVMRGCAAEVAIIRWAVNLPDVAWQPGELRLLLAAIGEAYR